MDESCSWYYHEKRLTAIRLECAFSEDGQQNAAHSVARHWKERLVCPTVSRFWPCLLVPLYQPLRTGQPSSFSIAATNDFGLIGCGAWQTSSTTTGSIESRTLIRDHRSFGIHNNQFVRFNQPSKPMGKGLNALNQCEAIERTPQPCMMFCAVTKACQKLYILFFLCMTLVLGTTFFGSTANFRFA
jgi:hypothetical protein